MRLKRTLFLGAVLLSALSLVGCGKTTVKLDKYITISAEGYDSMGTASYDFDVASFKKDYSGKIKEPKNNSELAGWILLTGETIEELFVESCVDGSFDKEDNLSNGDVITWKWDCDNTTAEEYFNVKLDYSDITYNVSGLSEVAKFNPFDYVEVSFSGFSPNGTASVIADNNKEEMYYIYLNTDKQSGLKNGDTITVEASLQGDEDFFVQQFGCVLEETSKTYTCDSLAYYVSDVKDIPDDMMSKMISQSEDAFKAYVAKLWDNLPMFSDLSLVGNYFLTLKDGMYGTANNYLYLVYKVSATAPDLNDTVEHYVYVRFEDIVILPDGTCSVDLSNYKTPFDNKFSSESFKYGKYYYLGYENLDSLFNNQVVKMIDKYQYTTSIN